MSRIQPQGSIRHSEAFERLSDILQYPPPPRLGAAAFRALPMIPGVRLIRGVRDAAGRTGYGLYLVDQDGRRITLIIDPVTYRFLGMRIDAQREIKPTLPPGAQWEPPTPKGAMIRSWAQLEQRFVDRAGQRS